MVDREGLDLFLQHFFMSLIPERMAFCFHSVGAHGQWILNVPDHRLRGVIGGQKGRGREFSVYGGNPQRLIDPPKA